MIAVSSLYPSSNVTINLHNTELSPPLKLLAPFPTNQLQLTLLVKVLKTMKPTFNTHSTQHQTMNYCFTPLNAPAQMNLLQVLPFCHPSIVFKGPVAWTVKRPETGPNWTDLDRTAGCDCAHFQMDEMFATRPFELVATFLRYDLKIPSKCT